MRTIAPYLPRLMFSVLVIDRDVTVLGLEVTTGENHHVGMPRDAYIQDPAEFTHKMLLECREVVLSRWLAVVDLSKERVQ